MMAPLVTAATAFAASLAVTPLVRRLAIACGATDVPDARRVHSRVTARAGGVGVVFAAVLALAIGGGLPDRLGPAAIAGAALLLVVGVIDDIISIRAHYKLLAQIVAAVLAVAGGLRFPLFAAADGTLLATFEAVLTGAWVVLITNAFNLSDGLDGLASGIATFAFLSLAAVGYKGHDPATTTIALTLAAAVLGFLPYNFNQASIFLGDAGSLVLGYALAVLPLVGVQGAPLPPLAALLLVALPATDTFIAIARRFLSRCLRTWSDSSFLRGLVDGLKNTVSPDRRHIHHRLLDLGLSQRRAVLLLYLATTSTSGLGYLVARSQGWPIDLFALGLGMIVIALVRALGFDELQPARSGLFLPVLRRIARHGWVIITIDLCLIAVAYASALVLTDHPRSPLLELVSALGLVAGAQLVVFGLLGVYRTSWWVTEVSGFGLLLRACALGTVAGYFGLRLLDLPTTGATMLVHYFLLLPAVTLMRFSHVLLTNAARSGPESERALIFGTAGEARQALHRLRRSGLGALEPVGFIEFRPRLQGRELSRLPVVGSLDGLATLVRERSAKHLVIADPALRGEALDWVRAVCRQLDVHVHRYVERLVPYDGRLATPPAELATFRPATDLWRHTARTANGNGKANGNGNGNGKGNGYHLNGNGQAANGNGTRHSGHLPTVPVDERTRRDESAPRGPARD